MGAVLDTERIRKDIAIFKRAESAAALATYFRRVVPKEEPLRGEAKESILQVANGYDSRRTIWNNSVKAGVLYAGAESFEDLFRVFDDLVSSGKELDLIRAFELVGWAEIFAPTAFLSKALEAFRIRLPAAMAPISSLINMREDADPRIRSSVLADLAGSRDDRIALVARIALDDKAGIIEILKRTAGMHPEIATLMERAGDLKDAEEARLNAFASGESFNDLMEFYQRTGTFTHRTMGFFVSIALDLISAGHPQGAYKVWELLGKLAAEFPRGNPLGSFKPRETRYLVTNAELGQIQCLFLSGQIDAGLSRLRAISSE